MFSITKGLYFMKFLVCVTKKRAPRMLFARVCEFFFDWLSLYLSDCKEFTWMSYKNSYGKNRVLIPLFVDREELATIIDPVVVNYVIKIEKIIIVLIERRRCSLSVYVGYVVLPRGCMIPRM